jgi:hypothetical protein
MLNPYSDPVLKKKAAKQASKRLEAQVEAANEFYRLCGLDEIELHSLTDAELIVAG